MMLKGLRVFKLTKKVSIQGVSDLWVWQVQRLLDGEPAEPVLERRGLSEMRLASYTQLSLGHLSRVNAIDGQMLRKLTHEDFTHNLS